MTAHIAFQAVGIVCHSSIEPESYGVDEEICDSLALKGKINPAEVD